MRRIKIPIYEYACCICGNIQEELHGMNEILSVQCSSCIGETERIISPCGWSLEGEGWYNPHNPMKRSRGGVNPKKAP